MGPLRAVSGPWTTATDSANRYRGGLRALRFAPAHWLSILHSSTIWSCLASMPRPMTGRYSDPTFSADLDTAVRTSVRTHPGPRDEGCVCECCGHIST